MSIMIMEACPTDAEAICRLNRDELGYDYLLCKTAEKLEVLLKRPRCRIHVAECGNTIVGYVRAADYDVLYAPHRKDILGIAVSSDFRRSGVGKLLLSAVEQWAKETGAAGIRLVSGASRTGAHQFYLACGYSESKDQKNFKKIF